MIQPGLLLEVLVITSVIQQGLCCQTGWLSYGTRCYRFFSSQRNRSEAEIACINSGAVLASLPSDGPFTFLSSQMYFQKEKSFWVGLLAINGSLQWVDGNTVQAAAWLGVAPTTSDNSQCFALENKKVKESPCSTAKGYVCEVSETTLTTPGLPCPKATDRFGSSCFWQIMKLGTRDEASAACEEKGGHLADLSDKNKVEYGKAMAIASNATFWLGATKSENNTWHWTNGNEFHFSHIVEPVNDMLWLIVKEGGCLRIGAYPKSQLGIRWYIGKCDEQSYAFCEEIPGAIAPSTITTETSTISTTLPVARCPNDNAVYSWVSHDESGMCFGNVYIFLEKQSWDSARQNCQYFGGDLASYNSKEEESVAVRSHAELYLQGFWIGLRRDPGSNVFRWSDGSALTYTNWAPGQPKLGLERALCVAHVGNQSLWEVSNCEYHRWFVCKVPKRIEPVIPYGLIAQPNTMIPCTNEANDHYRKWYYFEGHCYLLYDRNFRTWMQGKTFCEDNGAQLASVNSWRETDFILRMGHEGNHIIVHLWIGLSAIGVHSSYRWLDESPLNYVNWDEEDSEATENIESCVVFNGDSGVWQKRHCSTINGILCKKLNGSRIELPSKAPIPFLPGFCPRGWYTFEFNWTIYKCRKSNEVQGRIISKEAITLIPSRTLSKSGLIHENVCSHTAQPFGRKLSEMRSWEEANKKCKEIGADLVSIHSKKEQEFMDTLILEVIGKTWLGLYLEEVNSTWFSLFSKQRQHLYHWTDGSPVDYDNWEPFSSKKYGRDGDCVEMRIDSSLGEWNDAICTNPNSFICQLPKDPTLLTPGPNMQECGNPKGWARLGSSCYKVVSNAKNHSNWFQAQVYCKKEGGNLVSIPTHGVNTFLISILRELRSPLWIGMRDTKKNTYAWLGEWPLSYSNWDGKQPRDVSDSDNCAAIDSHGKWSIKDCFVKYPFICEVDTEGIPTLPPQPRSMCPNNSAEWRDVGGSRCYLIEFKEVTWNIAENICIEKGGHMASFHSYDEISALSFYLRDYYPLHIGFGQTNDGSFEWIDGSPVDFTNWAIGEPSGKDERCVEMRTTTYKWHSIQCHVKRSIICSIEKIPVPTIYEPKENTTAHSNNAKHRLDAGSVVVIVICVMVATTLLIAAYCHCSESTRRSWMRLSS